MGLILVVPGRSHGHSHGGKPSVRDDGTQSTEELENINIRAAFIHILGDTLCTLGLLIAAVIIKFKVSKTLNIIAMLSLHPHIVSFCTFKNDCFSK